MIRRSIAVSAIVALTLGLNPDRYRGTDPARTLRQDARRGSRSRPPLAVAEKGTVVSLGEGSGRELYLVQLEDAAVPNYAGGVKGLAPVQAADRSFAPDAAPERSYRDHVLSEQAALRRDIAGLTGRTAAGPFSYTDALNGIAVALTRDEALKVSSSTASPPCRSTRCASCRPTSAPSGSAPPASGTAPPPRRRRHQGRGLVVGILDSGSTPPTRPSPTP